MWSAIANFVKWLFVPDAAWLSQQIADMNAIMEQKLGLFFWLYNTMKNFFSCFSNLQNYTGFRVTSPDGEVVTLFYGDIWTTVTGYINPVLTGAFVILFCWYCLQKVEGMFER